MLGAPVSVRSNRCHASARWRSGVLRPGTRSQCLRTLVDHVVDFELRDPPDTPVYQQIAVEAVEMDAAGTRISLMARHFGVDARTVKKAIAWFTCWVLGSELVLGLRVGPIESGRDVRGRSLRGPDSCASTWVPSRARCPGSSPRFAVWQLAASWPLGRPREVCPVARLSSSRRWRRASLGCWAAAKAA